MINLLKMGILGIGFMIVVALWATPIIYMGWNGGLVGAVPGIQPVGFFGAAAISLLVAAIAAISRSRLNLKDI